MDLHRSCLYCKNLLVKETDEKNFIDFSKFRHPEQINDKKCEYLCLLDKVPCEDRDFYCHTFNPDFNEDKNGEDVQV